MKRKVIDGKEIVVFEDSNELIEYFIEKLANELEMKIDLKNYVIKLKKKR